uniref:FZ domain-containing protein n=1 Tax=Cyprinus carpio TaxID=7962 RepID=A0A8C2FIE3_CYPCA
MGGSPLRIVISLWCQLVIAAYSLEIGSYDLERGRPAKCEPIVIPMCQGIGYNLTRMPNFMDHENQREAAIKLNEFTKCPHPSLPAVPCANRHVRSARPSWR